jgi:hypothetical protein
MMPEHGPEQRGRDGGIADFRADGRTDLVAFSTLNLDSGKLARSFSTTRLSSIARRVGCFFADRESSRQRAHPGIQGFLVGNQHARPPQFANGGSGAWLRPRCLSCTKPNVIVITAGEFHAKHVALPRLKPQPVPTRMSNQLAMNAGLAELHEINLRIADDVQHVQALDHILASIQSKIKRVTTNAVNKLAATPMVKA